MAHDVDGIILAAGQSSRMGRPKPALTVGGESFLARAARALHAAGCRRVLAVVGGDGAQLADGLDVEIVVNPVADSEQIDSLRCALHELDGKTGGVLVLPVDVPLVAMTTCAAVVAAFRERPAPIVVPFYRGVAGHPILIGHDLFGDVQHGDWPEGVRTIILAHAHDMLEVDVSDPGILIDIDTPADYLLHVDQR